ncbi:hypothetical protein KKH14_01325 [Patescibacteria group bacterium]|nr:hypothetical protein [Patescibacteria group bacterium]
MNQKGFAKIILIVIILVILGVAGYFVFTKQNPQQSSTTKETLLNYYSKELGISFKYSSDLKVYQQDEKNILIKTPYTNPEHSLVVIQMGISKASNPQLATKESIDSLLKSLGQTTIEQGYKGNYQILKVSTTSQYYFLGSKGTFIIGDSLETIPWKEDIFQKEGVYQVYRLKFDAIRDSINFD